MTTKLRIAAAIAVLLVTSAAAEARPTRSNQATASECSVSMPCYGVENTTIRNKTPNRRLDYRRLESDGDVRIVSHPEGCPRRLFCGCGVSVKVFGKPKRELFLAANWLKYPRASAGPGMVAARRGHVMYIQSVDGNGNAVVYDPNSGGGKTRVHTRSLSGYRVVNPHGSFASN